MTQAPAVLTLTRLMDILLTDDDYEPIPPPLYMRLVGTNTLLQARTSVLTALRGSYWPRVCTINSNTTMSARAVLSKFLCCNCDEPEGAVIYVLLVKLRVILCALVMHDRMLGSPILYT